MARNTVNQQNRNGMMMGGGSDGGLAYVDAEALKQVDVPTQTLLGAANGAVAGFGISAGISLGVAFGNLAREQKQTSAKLIFGKMLSAPYVGAIIAGTAAIALLGGLARWSSASKHNEWSDRHYSFLENQASHAAREDMRTESKTEDTSPKR